MRRLIVAAMLAFPAAAAAQPGAVRVSGSEGGALAPARRQFWIWIEPNSPLRGFRASYPDAVREAVEEWRRAILPVEFTFVEDSSQANLLVLWRPRFDQPTQGRGTWWLTERLGFTRGEIEVALITRHGAPLTHALVRAIAIHEIGHLLGLHHVGDPHSIMSRTIQTTWLPHHDMRRAQILYRTVLDDERERGTR